MKYWSMIVAGACSVALAGEPVRFEAITDADHRFQGEREIQESLHGQVRIEIHQLDAAQIWEEELSLGLPADEELAKAMVEKRMEHMGKAQLRQRARSAYSGLMVALKYRLDRFPAVVVNGEAVVYGETDLTKVWRYYEKWNHEK